VSIVDVQHFPTPDGIAEICKELYLIGLKISTYKLFLNLRNIIETNTNAF